MFAMAECAQTTRRGLFRVKSPTLRYHVICVVGMCDVPYARIDIFTSVTDKDKGTNGLSQMAAGRINIMYMCMHRDAIECMSMGYTKRSPFDKWLPRVDSNKMHSLMHTPSRHRNSHTVQSRYVVAALLLRELIASTISTMINSDGLQPLINSSGVCTWLILSVLIGANAHRTDCSNPKSCTTLPGKWNLRRQTDSEHLQHKTRNK